MFFLRQVHTHTMYDLHCTAMPYVIHSITNSIFVTCGVSLAFQFEIDKHIVWPQPSVLLTRRDVWTRLSWNCRSPIRTRSWCLGNNNEEMKCSSWTNLRALLRNDKSCTVYGGATCTTCNVIGVHLPTESKASAFNTFMGFFMLKLQLFLMLLGMRRNTWHVLGEGVATANWKRTMLMNFKMRCETITRCWVHHLCQKQKKNCTFTRPPNVEINKLKKFDSSDSILQLLQCQHDPILPSCHFMPQLIQVWRLSSSQFTVRVYTYTIRVFRDWRMTKYSYICIYMYTKPQLVNIIHVYAVSYLSSLNSLQNTDLR